MIDASTIVTNPKSICESSTLDLTWQLLDFNRTNLLTEKNGELNLEEQSNGRKDAKDERENSKMNYDI